MATQSSLSITTFSYFTVNSPGTAIIVATFTNANQYKWISSAGSVQEVVHDWDTISDNWNHRQGALWDKELPIHTGKIYYLQVRAGESGAVTTSNALGPWDLSFTANEPKIRFVEENTKVEVSTDERQGERTGGINVLEIDHRAPGIVAWRTDTVRNTDTGWSLLSKQWTVPSDLRIEDSQFRARWGHEPRTGLNQATSYGGYGSIEYYPEVPRVEVAPITDIPTLSIAYNQPAVGQFTVTWSTTSEPEAYIEFDYSFRPDSSWPRQMSDVIAFSGSTGETIRAVSYTHLTLPTTPYV